ncbi:lipid IV(A) 3-deoxy-D-manno-octulosonic acid transferase [Thiolapillus brandeum]|uniref:3-deoxy-D-manno-octulosonic acid transferase n=1 Tax=Thiolapillus brandeum TaxID=1076588 RepID=A0A7U6JGR5_9GAMM|nr:lipid IV(A) 3-deoxy-D-manno-octulosonic acid transferase [Thiolapillus brandeum]BAO43073.1 3-deoxy-D-manno-octulosonic-acid transferase [Thiolapillus brandeum]
MRMLYTLVLYLMLPGVLLRLLWRSLRVPAYRERWKERFGRPEIGAPSGGVWIHAVSVGEVQAIEPLVRHLREQHPDLALTITTATPTGSERVRLLFGSDVYHSYCPYDLPFAVRGFLQRVRPRMLIMVETEIWPNLLAICEQQGIPTLLANGRLSHRSARGYGRLGRFTRRVFSGIRAVAAQSGADAERFIDLGVPPERVSVTGSIKFDMRIPASVQEQIQVLRRAWGDRPVWVAASTHEGEEEQVLAAHRKLLEAVPTALLVLVPRHPERFDRVAALVVRHGFPMCRRSLEQPCGENTQVFLGDTMGELPVFLGGADVAYIGGSLVKVGGHNMLEAAAQGVPVVFGPHVFNFSGIARLLRDREAGVMVEDGSRLAEQVAAWLQDASERSRIGENGRQVVEENRGALQRLAALVDDLLA